MLGKGDHVMTASPQIEALAENPVWARYRSVPAGSRSPPRWGWAALGYEIVDCHYPGWALTPPDMVADFGCHAALVIGTRRRTTVEEVLALSDLTITLRCDGEDVATGSGTDVLGGPVDAVCAVAREPRDGADSRGRRDHDRRADSEGPASDRGTCWTAQAQASLSFDPITVRLT
jgi:hypothetical protein